MACNRIARTGAMALVGALDPRNVDARRFCREPDGAVFTFRIDPALPPKVRTVTLSCPFFKRDGV